MHLQPIFCERFIADGNVYDIVKRTKFTHEDIEAVKAVVPGIINKQWTDWIKNAYNREPICEETFRAYIGVAAPSSLYPRVLHAIGRQFCSIIATWITLLCLQGADGGAAIDEPVARPFMAPAAAPTIVPSEDPAAAHVNAPPPAAAYVNAPPPYAAHVNAPPPAATYVNAPPPAAAYFNAPPPYADYVNVPPPAAAGVNVQQPPPSDAGLATLLKIHGDAIMAANSETVACKDARIAALEAELEEKNKSKTAVENALVDAVGLAAKLKRDHDHSEHLRHKNDGMVGVEVKKSLMRERKSHAETRELLEESLESHAETRESLEESRGSHFEERLLHSFTKGALNAIKEEYNLCNVENTNLKVDNKIKDKRMRALEKELDSYKKSRNGDPANPDAIEKTVLAYLLAVGAGTANRKSLTFDHGSLCRDIKDFPADPAAVKPDTARQVSAALKALKFTGDTAGISVVMTKKGSPTPRREFNLARLRIHLQQFAPAATAAAAADA